jgi:hypothetical protein
VWVCQLVEHGLVRPSFVPPMTQHPCSVSSAAQGILT